MICNGEMSINCATSIARILKDNKSLLELTITTGCISSDSIIAIMEALSNNNNTTLTKLAIYGNTIRYNDIVAIGCVLKTNHALTEPLLGSCTIDADASRVIGFSLKQNTTSK
jgi:hypothetical protein